MILFKERAEAQYMSQLLKYLESNWISKGNKYSSLKIWLAQQHHCDMCRILDITLEDSLYLIPQNISSLTNLLTFPCQSIFPTHWFSDRIMRVPLLKPFPEIYPCCFLSEKICPRSLENWPTVHKTFYQHFHLWCSTWYSSYAWGHIMYYCLVLLLLDL